MSGEKLFGLPGKSLTGEYTAALKSEISEAMGVIGRDYNFFATKKLLLYSICLGKWTCVNTALDISCKTS